MPHGTQAFFYPYSLGTDLNEYPNWVSINERVVLYKLLVCAFMRVRLVVGDVLKRLVDGDSL